MSLDEALTGIDVPPDIREALAVVTVPYYSFQGERKTGVLVVHKELATETVEIFTEIHTLRFPIEKIEPLSSYGWDDIRSMADNNTSAFNYRLIIATNRLSNHSYGRAIDINTRLNPYYGYDGKTYPEGAAYDPSLPGTFAKDGPVVNVFKKYGWNWGGEWTGVKDYQHFEKPLP